MRYEKQFNYKKSSVYESNEKYLVKKYEKYLSATALTPRIRNSNDRIPFTLTYHPFNNSIKSIVNRNFSLLQSDAHTSTIFSDRPLFSFKRDRNLRSFLAELLFKVV